jgi:SAM-dependent methyltransferase
MVSGRDRTRSLSDSRRMEVPPEMMDLTARPVPLTISRRDRARLWLKWLLFPGTNWVSRDKAAITRHFLEGTPERPVATLDCGCGNAFFSLAAVRRGARCVGITIHDWERRNCEEMRDYLGVSPAALEVRRARLDELAADPAQRGRYDQVLLLDVIEHIRDDRAALRQIHSLLAEDGFVYITTPDRDWQGNAWKLRVTRHEDGWHVRNGYTFEQLEGVLRECGFEPVDRLRFGTLGSRLVTSIQHRLFGRWIDPLTVATFPLLKLIAAALAPWRDTHTVGVVARRASPKLG